MNQSNQKQASYIGEIKANTRPWETLHVTLTSIEEENQVQADLRVLGETFPIVAEKTGSAKKPADFDQMVTHLRKRIEITDADKPRLHRLIHEKMYFRVAYFSKLLSTRTESRHAILDDLIQLFEFDNYVRSSIARLTPDIEQFAKATLVELFLERDLDSEVYLQKSLYKYASSSDKRNLDKTLSICASEVKANRTTAGTFRSGCFLMFYLLESSICALLASKKKCCMIGSKLSKNPVEIIILSYKLAQRRSHLPCKRCNSFEMPLRIMREFMGKNLFSIHH